MLITNLTAADIAAYNDEKATNRAFSAIITAARPESRLVLTCEIARFRTLTASLIANA